MDVILIVPFWLKRALFSLLSVTVQDSWILLHRIDLLMQGSVMHPNRENLHLAAWFLKKSSWETSVCWTRSLRHFIVMQVTYSIYLKVWKREYHGVPTKFKWLYLVYFCSGDWQRNLSLEDALKRYLDFIPLGSVQSPNEICLCYFAGSDIHHLTS